MIDAVPKFERLMNLVAFLLAFSAQAVGKTYNVLSKVEWWARMTTGWVFILVGAWFSLKYVFQVG